MINDVYILRFLEKRASKVEEQELASWLEASDSNRVYFEEYRKAWKASNDLVEYHKVNLEEEWDLFKNGASDASIQEAEVKSPRIIRWISLSAAACVLLLVGLFSYINYDSNPIQTLITGDSSSMLSLSDGSSIKLFENSKLEYLSSFEGLTERKITLEGKATFDIAKDETKPFLIQTNDTEVEVLGTSFTMVSEGELTSIDVEEGKVKFVSKANKTQHLVLTAGDKAQFNATEGFTVEYFKAEEQAIPVKEVEKKITKEVPEKKIVTPVQKKNTVVPKAAKPVIEEKLSKYKLHQVLDHLDKKYDDFKLSKKCKVDDDATIMININADINSILNKIEDQYELEYKENKKCPECKDLKSIRKK